MQTCLCILIPLFRSRITPQGPASCDCTDASSSMNGKSSVKVFTMQSLSEEESWRDDWFLTLLNTGREQSWRDDWFLTLSNT